MTSIFELLSLVLLVGAALGVLSFVKVRRLETEVSHLRDEVSVMRRSTSPSSSPERPPSAQAIDADPPQRAGSEPAAGSREAQSVETDATESSTDDPASSPRSKPQAPPEPDAGKRGLLDELGVRWSVWVGGLALALGAVFLLRHSIEAGLFGPGLRVGLTAVLGLAALAAGEWLGRSHPEERSEALRHAHIPGVLTAAGILALFGSVYAGHALHGFVGPTTAFGLMGLVSLGGLALGLRRGTALSGLGLVGSLLTPWLAATSEPAYAGLYAYLLIVIACAFVLARHRGWTWLGCAGAAGGLVWAYIGLGLHLGDEFWLWTLYVGGLNALATAPNALHRLPSMRREPDRVQDVFLPSVTYGATGFLLLLMLYEDQFSLRAFHACLVGAALGLAAAWRRDRLAGMALSAGALASAAILLRGGAVAGSPWRWPVGGIYIPTPLEGEWGRVFIVALVTAAALIGVAASGAGKHRAATGNAISILSLAGGVFPPLTFAALWLIGAKGVTHPPFALVGVALTGAYAMVVERFLRAGAEARTAPIASLPLNVFTAGACAAFLLALVAGFAALPLTLALTATLPALGVLATLRPVRALRVACAAFGAVLGLHILRSLTGPTDVVGSGIVVNGLWFHLALPAAAAWAASRFLRRPSADKWSQAMEALAVTFAALFAVFQVRHYMNGGDLFAPELSLEELSLQILVSLCFSLGLSRIKDAGPRGVFSAAAMTAMGISLFGFVFGNLITMNPFFNATVNIHGGVAVNGLLSAYLLPGLLLGAIAWLQRRKRPGWYLNILKGISFAALIAYMTAMVRFGHHGGEEMALARAAIGNAEQYTYSIVWLIFGVALLASGVAFGAREPRIASAAVMTLTAAKVFLIDMSALEGILRALSFVGLGATLIAMGLVYQRVLVGATDREGAS